MNGVACHAETGSLLERERVAYSQDEPRVEIRLSVGN